MNVFIYTCAYPCIYIGSTTRPEKNLRDMNTIGPPVCPRLPPNINVAHPPAHSLTCSAHPQRPACPAPEARGGRAGGTCSASTLNKGEAEGGGGLGLYDYLFRCWTEDIFNVRVPVPMSDEDHIQYTRICSDVGRRSYPVYEYLHLQYMSACSA